LPKRRLWIIASARWSAPQDEIIPMKLELFGHSISRTILACAGMGATMGMLVGGTTFGVPTAIAAAIIGAIGGGVLGRFVEWKDEHSGLPSKRRRGSGQTRHYLARSISERTLHSENSDLGNQAGTARRKPRHHDALVSCGPSNQLAQNSVILADVKTSREEPQLQKRRDTGDLVKFIGVIGIIAVMSIAVGAALIGSSGVAAIMPGLSERQMVEMGR
jgi:hypothetical protein